MSRTVVFPSKKTDLPEFGDQGLSMLAEKLSQLWRHGELKYNEFVKAAYKANGINIDVNKTYMEGFSRWLQETMRYNARGEDYTDERIKHWVKKDQFEALVKYLFETKPWVEPYFDVRYSSLIRSPVFYGLTPIMGIERAHRRNAAAHACGVYQIYRPTLTIDNHVFIGRLEIKRLNDCSTLSVTETYHTEGIAFWEMPGIFLPISSTTANIVSFSSESAPKVMYLTHINSHRRSETEGRLGDINYMSGYIADLHEDKLFYTVPVYIERVQDASRVSIETVPNDQLKRNQRYKRIVEFFNRSMDGTKNVWSNHEIT